MESNWAAENLRVIRTLMERSAVYRRALAPLMLLAGGTGTGMTDGNITAHMRTLQEAGYVSVTKVFKGGRPLTTCSLTAPGRKAFTTYINLLEKIVEQTKSAK